MGGMQFSEVQHPAFAAGQMTTDDTGDVVQSLGLDFSLQDALVDAFEREDRLDGSWDAVVNGDPCILRNEEDWILPCACVAARNCRPSRTTPQPPPHRRVAETSTESGVACSPREDARRELTQVEKAKEAKRLRRKRKRHEEQRNRDIYSEDSKISRSRSKKYREPAVLQTTFTVQDLPATRNGFTGKLQRVQPKAKDLQELLDEGLQIFKWDGRKSIVLVDREGHVFGVLVGQPGGDESWPDIVNNAHQVMLRLSSSIHIPLCKKCKMLPPEEHCKDCGNRRGHFSCIACGVSYGGGQTEPRNLSHDDVATKEAKEELLGDPSLGRLAGFQNSAFSWFTPKLYRHYCRVIGKLHDHHPGLHQNFSNSVFPAASFNLGPQVVTFEHVDSGNLPNGLCAITSLGNFDSVQGGHLILRQLGLIVEFPSGSTVLLPSATLSHGNVPVQPGETRTSFTQYAAGGLFRWVHYGFRKWTVLAAEDKERATSSTQNAPRRWQEALQMFSKVSERHRDRMNCWLSRAARVLCLISRARKIVAIVSALLLPSCQLSITSITLTSSTNVFAMQKQRGKQKGKHPVLYEHPTVRPVPCEYQSYSNSKRTTLDI
ncbi:hypothetical protein NM688_g8750 [Phlebia brevispora]|uniref:Uncharacterized protein n=1 Tax=Phlebia brevispora TaxID=194682 RepID=A0ACC1RNC6_9APHY|nr:hypothetical protein NM688_g8750 [Phlebia brevispora]